ncbi:hypothetical protein PHJA_001504400 [Phtheirospermum japonicum]|uniref:Uncharacterized protein n=1 Tax=Phtheirospermum japonicum TaxID=374723 RepID=A0A830C1T0_9LAMI|nr:hypothetical protein PHJA_001504400 [Phtheirospermum japonicum]
MESKNCRDKSVFSKHIEKIDEEEEMEMEKFYAMVRTMKNQLHQLQENNKRKKAAVGPGGWAPVFQWEDFTTEIEFKKHVPTFPNPINISNDRKQEGKRKVGSTSGLNLELNL